MADYLHALGVTTCYCSPILRASEGSTHGYDISNHRELNPELGTLDDLRQLSRRLRDLGMGLIVDFVPNHMGIDPRTNAWWRDVLAHGPASVHAGYFDIDWRPVKAELRDKVLLPILGDQYGEVLARGELRLEIVDDEVVLKYFDRILPINPRDAARARAELSSYNGTPGDAASFDQLHELLEAQAYRLASWRTAFDEINYRRFFDINELAAVRVEDPAVFEETHALLLDLIKEGTITGIRIDHPDGLYDPTAYFRSLDAAIAERLGKERGEDVYVVVEKVLAHGERLCDTWLVDGTTGYNVLNVLNGLFVQPEGLTDLRRVYRRFTGIRQQADETIYAAKRFMMRSAMASELNVLARALSRICEDDRRHRDFTLNELRRALGEVIACFPVYRTYLSPDSSTAEDIGVVDAAVNEARRRNPVQEPSIFAFIRETLLPGSSVEGPAHDARVSFMRKFQQYTAPIVAKGLEDTAFYTDVLLLSANEVGGDLRHRARSVVEFHRDNLNRLTRWPLEMTAGSTHDTKRGEDARARINVLSEVPSEWRVHLNKWATINESARTQLDGTVAPDRNDEWMFYQALIGAWPAKTVGEPVPESADRVFVERMQEFMHKALKEAKRHTGWLHQNVAYEQAVESFVQQVLAGDRARPFLASFVPFQRRIAWFGMINSLAQLVLRLGSPGIPDIYQGSELWNLTLVDPDNRRPVDFTERCRMLRSLDSLVNRIETNSAGVARELSELVESWPDGRIKLFTTAVGLRARRANPTLFLHGEYEGLGGDADDPHLIAFSRRSGDDEIIVVVPRFSATQLRGAARLPVGIERWRTASIRLPRRLARAKLRNIFTGEVAEPVVYRDRPWLLAGSAFQSFPAAILTVIPERQQAD